MGKNWFLTGLFSFGLLHCGNVYGEGPLDQGSQFLYPQLGFKYVQFLPNGHLHQNKPRYGQFKWRILESVHFWIYTYDDSGLAEIYLTEAEKIYEEFSVKTKMNAFGSKIRVVIYNTAKDFEETNLVTSLVPDGLGGLTELIRWKRVVVAYRDSLDGFRNVLRHELYHRFQTEFLKLTLTNIFTRRSGLPLWFMEGSAEYFGRKWDAAGELIIRDGYLNNYLESVKEVHWPTVALVYKQGQFVVKFLADRHKDKGDVVSAIFKASVKLKFPAAFEKVTGESLADFEKALNLHLEKRYQHLKLEKDIADESHILGNALLLAAKDNFFVTKKRILGRVALFINWTDGKRVYSKKIAEDGYFQNAKLRGLGLEIDPDFGFHEHGASFSQNQEVVYAIDAGKRDEIRIQSFDFNAEKKKFTLGKPESYSFKGIRDIRNPVLTVNNEILFIGRKWVFSEVFLFDRKTGALKQLSTVKRNCRSFAYSPFLGAVVVSWENDGTQSFDLAVSYLQMGEWNWLTQTSENEFDPAFSPDGKKLLYVSDKGLAHNIYFYDFYAQSVTPITDAKIGVFRPQWFQDRGLLFNSLQDRKLLVQIAPLPAVGSVGGAAPAISATSPQESSEEKQFLALVPNAAALTVTETIISPDKSKALAVVNRVLSLDGPKDGETELGFYIVDLATDSATSFSLEPIDEIDKFAGAEFLNGTKILFQKWNEKDGNDIYVYDWSAKTLHLVQGAEWKLKILSFGKNKNSFFRISPDKNYLLLVRDGKFQIYDIKANRFFRQEVFDDILEAVFVSESKVAAIVKDKEGVLGERRTKIFYFDLAEDTKINSWIEVKDQKEKFVSWHLFPDSQKVLIATYDSEADVYNLWILDVKENVLNLVKADLPVLKSVKANGAVILVETKNPFGLKRMLAIDNSGNVTVEDDKVPYANKESLFLTVGNPVNPSRFRIEKPVPAKIRKRSSFPKFYTGAGGGSIGFGGNNIYLSMLALDDLNDQALFATVLLEDFRSGFVNLKYYHLPSGKSFGLDYWRFKDGRQRIDIGVTQNIFLDRFLNWDITLKEQQVSVKDNKWLQTRLGTTFSLDTRVWDAHGPRSGTAIFSGIETGVNKSFQHQNLDLNLDSRYYWPWAERSGLALRLAGGHSLGPNPTRFIWGGNQTMRGISLFSQSGNSYVLQSAEIRIPIFDFAGAQVSGPVDKYTWPLTKFIDIRGGIYSDVGDLWYTSDQRFWYFSDHKDFKLQHSIGYFLNVPLIIGYGSGFNIRFNQGLFGNNGWNFWLSYDW